MASSDRIPGSAATAVDASDEPAVDAGLCNDLINAATNVALQRKVGVTPATTAGTIVPGTYVLTEDVRFRESALAGNRRPG